MAKLSSATKRKEKAEAKCWEPLEVLVLAQSWIDISEDATVGKDQKHDRFWIRVLHRFHKGMNRGENCSKHQVYSKWGKMNKEIMLFNDLYKNMKRQWKSGESDDQNVRRAYRSGSKRNRTSESDHTTSDARVQFDLNEDESVPVSPPSRPMGRDKAKSKGKGKGKALDLDELKEIWADMKELRKQRDNDMRVLSLDTLNMTGDELEVILAMKEEVKKHYANRG
ncbi:uncharacterized protein LOC111878587 [Lactuca sativa]|uniref:uncharacterized protein LOC111878587 n=1 Tax=Lactuca sativa TaxID=4236 RepID=UPI000CD8DADB|nr:uncharacterized protein LOC111878587 [Lactuca sativa]